MIEQGIHNGFLNVNFFLLDGGMEIENCCAFQW